MFLPFAVARHGRTEVEAGVGGLRRRRSMVPLLVLFEVTTNLASLCSHYMPHLFSHLSTLEINWWFSVKKCNIWWWQKNWYTHHINLYRILSWTDYLTKMSRYLTAMSREIFTRKCKCLLITWDGLTKWSPLYLGRKTHFSVAELNFTELTLFCCLLSFSPVLVLGCPVYLTVSLLLHNCARLRALLTSLQSWDFSCSTL